MNPIPFPNADRELRRAWVVDVDAALAEAEGLLRASAIPLGRRVALKVEIAYVRASLALEQQLLNGNAR